MGSYMADKLLTLNYIINIINKELPVPAEMVRGSVPCANAASQSNEALFLISTVSL